MLPRPDAAVSAVAMHYSPPGVLRLQSKGTLDPSAVYIVRSADADLESALIAGEFAYVLTTRQMGKSSLRVRVGQRLASQTHRCVHLDLSMFGGADEPTALSDWIFSLTSEIAPQLGLPDPLDFYLENSRLLPMVRLVRYLRHVVLEQVSGHIVIFIDEIDNIRKLQAGGMDTDALLAAIRAIANARADDPVYRRLTFCLLGVASPGELILNPEITPFNIGRAIALEDFSRSELDALLPALPALGACGPRYLDEVYRQTCGHPAMTLALCEQLAAQPPEPRADATAVVRGLVDELFIQKADHESALTNVVQRLGSQHNVERLADLLSLYRRLLQGEQIVASRTDPGHMELQLCGVVAPRLVAGSRVLAIRNPVFARVFDAAWVSEREGKRMLGEALRLWREHGDKASLLRGASLVDAQQWLDTHQELATREEHHFVRLSLQATQEDERQAVLAEKLRIQRRNLIGLGGVILLLLVAIGLLVRTTSRAEREKLHAEKESERAEKENYLAKEATRSAEENALVADNRRKEVEQRSLSMKMRHRGSEFTEQSPWVG